MPCERVRVFFRRFPGKLAALSWMRRCQCHACCTDPVKKSLSPEVEKLTSVFQKKAAHNLITLSLVIAVSLDATAIFQI